MLEIGSVLDGKYKILNEIGRGGMSVVYQAWNEKLAQNVAIKEVRKDGVNAQSFEVVRQGLVAETNILKRLRHPGLPRIIDIIDANDSFVIVMDLIEGRSMDKALDDCMVRDANGKVVEVHGLPERYVIEWAKQVCDVFQYLHTRKPPIIYRDMKPSNIMLKPDGNICIIDFGTAREFKERNVKDTTTLGTVGYAAPEQYGGAGQRQSDARTDVYNLGATIYHLVTGYTPNPSAPPYYGMKPIRQINSMLSPGLEKIILKCCQQRPEDRYQDCLELLYALEHVDDDDISDRKRFKAFLGTSIACIAMALIGTGFLIASNSQRSQSFSTLIAKATDATIQMTNDERIDDCNEAIELDPDNIEGYEALLSVISSTDDCCEDENITDAEAAEFEKISSNSDALIAASAEDYGKLCYDVGHALWFNYRNDLDSDDDSETSKNESDRIEKARSWFDKARNNLPEDNKYYALADMYYRIGDYNKNIQTWINEDDDKGRYLEYWEDMERLLDVTAEETQYPRLQMYRMVVNAVVRYATSFANDGVTAQEMSDTLDEIEAGLNAMEFTEGANSVLRNNILESMTTARTYVSLVS